MASGLKFSPDATDNLYMLGSSRTCKTAPTTFFKLMALAAVWLWTAGCMSNGEISNIDGLSSVSLQKQKVYLDQTTLTISEGSAALINVATQEKSTSPLILNLMLTGPSSGRFQSLPLTVTIPAGNISQSILLQTIDDLTYQPQQTFTLTVSSFDSAVEVNPAILTIVLKDNDLPPPTPPLAPTQIKIPQVAQTTNKLSIGSLGFFVASDPVNGTELWRTDGTAAGTFILKDINPGSASSAPSSLINVNGTLFFVATSAAEGTELWKSDGTPAGTVLVMDIVPGAQSSSPSELTVFGTKLVFVVTDSSNHSVETLWVTDGTLGGTAAVTPLSYYTAGSGGPSGIVHRITVMNGFLWMFAAPDAYNNGRIANLIKSDGIPGGTTTVIKTNFDNVHGISFMAANTTTNRLFFDDGSDTEMWISDGTLGGTVQTVDDTMSAAYPTFSGVPFSNGLVFYKVYSGVCNMYFSSGPGAATVALYTTACPSNFIKMGSSLYFTMITNNGNELWKTDGTAVGTTVVKEIGPGAASGLCGVPVLAPNAGRLYFCGNDGTNGDELWVSDGTSGGTTMVKDLNPGAGSTSIGEIFEVGSSVYVSISANGGGAELWKTDGTSGGTALVKDLNGGSGSSWPGNFLAVGTNLIFSAYETSLESQVMHSSDGTSLGTVTLSSSATLPLNNPGWLMATLGSQNYIMGVPGGTVIELYKTSGTSATTTKSADILSNGSCTSLPWALSVVNGKLVFDLATNDYGREFWFNDGVAGVASLLKDMVPGTGSMISSFWGPKSTMFDMGNGKSIFMGGNTTTEAEPWITDGTPAGTSLIKDISPGSSSSSSPSGFTRMGNLVFFSASVSLAANGYEMWVTDGTSAGTVLVKETNPGAGYGVGMSYAPGMDIGTVYNGRFYFMGYTSGSFPTMSNPRLWSTDGTPAGTFSVHSTIQPITQATVYNGLMYFGANDTSGAFGAELYASDGTSANTVLVKDIRAGGASAPANLTVVGDKLVFFADDGVNGLEPWVTDGTSAGTVLLKDTVTGATGMTLSMKYVYGNTMYFVSVGTSSHYELWQTDGTPLGTSMVTDLTANSTGALSGATAIKGLNGNFYFTTSVGDLWAADPLAKVATKVAAPSGLTFLFDGGTRLYFKNAAGDLFATP